MTKNKTLSKRLFIFILIAVFFGYKFLKPKVILNKPITSSLHKSIDAELNSDYEADSKSKVESQSKMAVLTNESELKPTVVPTAENDLGDDIIEPQDTEADITLVDQNSKSDSLLKTQQTNDKKWANAKKNNKIEEDETEEDEFDGNGESNFVDDPSVWDQTSAINENSGQEIRQ
jgi:hypothetical protein